MNKNQKTMIFAATLAVLASSLAGACSAQSESATAADISTAASDPSAGTGYTDGSYTVSAVSSRGLGEILRSMLRQESE